LELFELIAFKYAKDGSFERDGVERYALGAEYKKDDKQLIFKSKCLKMEKEGLL